MKLILILLSLLSLSAADHGYSYHGFNKYAVTVNVISVVGGGALRVTFHPDGNLITPKYAKFTCKFIGPGIGALTSIGQARMMQSAGSFSHIHLSKAVVSVHMLGPYLQINFWDLRDRFIGSTFTVGVGAGLVGAIGFGEFDQYSYRRDDSYDYAALDGLEEDQEDDIDVSSLQNVDEAELERLLSQEAVSAV